MNHNVIQFVTIENPLAYQVYSSIKINWFNKLNWLVWQIKWILWALDSPLIWKGAVRIWGRLKRNYFLLTIITRFCLRIHNPFLIIPFTEQSTNTSGPLIVIYGRPMMYFINLIKWFNIPKIISNKNKLHNFPFKLWRSKTLFYYI